MAASQGNFLVIIPSLLFLITRGLKLNKFFLFSSNLVLITIGWLFIGVINGIYRRTRNPMIFGVALILLGEAILFMVTELFLWFLLFWIGNHIYFIKIEEPNLIQRFGEEYLLYMKHVPRWIPRLKPWIGGTDNNCMKEK